MSVHTIPCMHPQSCGVTFHIIGSPAARRCSSYEGKEYVAPPTPRIAAQDWDHEERWSPNTPKSQKRLDKDGALHSDDGPAMITYHRSGGVKSMEYASHGSRHRDDGPAYSEFSEEGDVLYEEYRTKGVLNRNKEDGPAKIWYDEGFAFANEFWENGEEIL